MAILQILTVGNPALKERAKEVDLKREEIGKLARDMAQTMYEGSGIGLAATQCGVMKRVIVFDVVDEEESQGPAVLVNPMVMPLGDERCAEEEGCLSVPDVKILIERPARVRVKGQDERGEPVDFEAEEMLARVIQHECDHLDGILILDRASKEERRRALRQQREAAEERRANVVG